MCFPIEPTDDDVAKFIHSFPIIQIIQLLFTLEKTKTTIKMHFFKQDKINQYTKSFSDASLFSEDTPLLSSSFKLQVEL